MITKLFYKKRHPNKLFQYMFISRSFADVHDFMYILFKN